MDKQKIKKNIIIIFFLLMMMVVAFVSSEGFWKKSGNSIQLVLNNSYYLNLTSSVGYINNYPICTSGNNYCNLTSSQYNLTYNHTTATYTNYNPIWSSTDNTSKVNLNSTYYNLLLYGYNQSSDEISLWYKYDNDRITPKNNYSLYIAHNLFFNYNSSFIWYQNWTWYDVIYTYNSTTETTMNDFLNGIINYLNITRQSGNITLNTNQNNLQDTLLLMHFDDNFTLNTNLTDDVSIYNNNGYCINETSCPVFNSSGYIGGAFEFDGKDYIYVPFNPLLKIGNGKPFTISTWVKITSEAMAGGTDYIIGRATSGTTRIYLALDYTGGSKKVAFTVATNGVSVNYIGNANEWVHITAVFNGSSTFIYQNGGNANIQNLVFSGSYPSDMYISGYNPTYGVHFNGTIDELRIWNRTLTAEEALRDYQAGLKKLQPSLNNYEQNGTYNSQVFDLGNNANASQISFGYDVPKTSYYPSSGLKFYWDGSGNYSLVNLSQRSSAFAGTSFSNSWVGNNATTYFNGTGHVIDRNATEFNLNAILFEGNEAFNLTDMSWSSWIKPSMDTSLTYIVSGGGGMGGKGWGSVYTSINRTYCDIMVMNGSRITTTATTSTIVPRGSWTHLTCTIDRDGLMKIYKNGVFINSKNISMLDGIPLVTFPIFAIGAYGVVSSLSTAPNLAYPRFNGTIDEVAIWNRALSSDEISAMYNSSVQGNIRLQTKVSSNITLTGANWSDYYIANGSVQNLVNLISPYRYLQYRTLFDTLDTNVTPVLTDVNFTWIANTSNITIINNYTWQQTLNVSRIYSQQGFLYIEDPTDNSRICTQGNGMCINGTGTSTFLPLWNSIKQLTNSIISQLGNWINIAGNLNVAGNINATNITIAGNTGISRTIQVVNYTNLVVVQYCNMTFTGGILTSSNC
jgi:hypothetical protein